MLELRPNCERCDTELPPNSSAARICSYECTFCSGCVEGLLGDVCPNCGGGFSPRPIRPVRAWRPELGLEHDPPATRRRHTRYADDELAAFAEQIYAIPPEKR